ncbi:hypothetical protein [Actinomadura violacea]|uniref:Uncharacterized protein n=1 Tax=Actinomadura violacea TaxID=2819934 RepID=A0ABS3RMW0_9ACTN|nr:hypothetical protein [Actinomadura violacea]MBO2458067.1 hypothetical protein [Actinomadura violacea]
METPFLTMGRGVELTQVISREPMPALRFWPAASPVTRAASLDGEDRP